MKNKHFTIEERAIIEERLNEGMSVHRIELLLHRPDSSVVREILRNRSLVYSPTADFCDGYLSAAVCNKRFDKDECLFEGEHRCYRDSCRGCNIMCNSQNCNEFKVYVCKYLKKTPFVCNGCTNHCYHDSPKYKYLARKADMMYRDKLKESRSGISISPKEMEVLDNLVSPLILKGQSIRAIYMTHKDEIPVSEATLYEYVDRCYLTARNIDLPRKVKFKVRYSHGKREQSFQTFVVNRTYMDFTKYLDEFPNTNVWEMDTVIGTPGGKCLLTLLFRKSHFMIAYLLNNHSQEAVITALNDLCEQIGIEMFQRLFEVILTDRGIEFGNPYALECDKNGEIKTKVFYCDPYCSW